MQLITTSLVVNFIGNLTKSATLSAEIDTRPTGYNNGRNTFMAGESVGLLIRASDIVRANPISVTPSYGSSTYHGVVTETFTESINFTNISTSTTSRIPKAITNTLWFGNNLGSLTSVDNIITSSVTGVGVVEVTYTTESLLYSIDSPPILGGRDYFNILTVIQGTDGKNP